MPILASPPGAELEPAHPDTLDSVRVVEIGALLGGTAGQHATYVQVRRTHD